MESQKGRPDVVLGSAVISACEKASQWQEAIFLVQHLRNLKKLDAHLVFKGSRGKWLSEMKLQ